VGGERGETDGRRREGGGFKPGGREGEEEEGRGRGREGEEKGREGGAAR